MPVSYKRKNSMKKSKSSKVSKLSKLSKTKTRSSIRKMKVGKYEPILCANTIVNLPTKECSVKHCTSSKQYKDNVKKLTKLNKQYYASVAKKCKIDIDNYDMGEKWTPEQMKCDFAQQKTTLYKNMLKLENQTDISNCIDTHCLKEKNIADDCIEMEEEQCRIKYKDIIENSKQKILPIDKCVFTPSHI